MPTSVRLTQDLDSRLTDLAKNSGRSKAYYIRAMVEQSIEDFEDTQVCESRLKDLMEGRSRTYTLEEVKKEIGLDN